MASTSSPSTPLLPSSLLSYDASRHARVHQRCDDIVAICSSVSSLASWPIALFRVIIDYLANPRLVVYSNGDNATINGPSSSYSLDCNAIYRLIHRSKCVDHHHDDRGDTNVDDVNDHWLLHFPRLEPPEGRSTMYTVDTRHDRLLCIGNPTACQPTSFHFDGWILLV